MFSGMPAYNISTRSKTNLIRYVDEIISLGMPKPARSLFVALIGFYILLIFLNFSPWLALCGAIAYGFSSFLIISMEAGHNTKVHAMAYMAPVITGILLTYRGKILWGIVLTGIALSLEIMCNHIQMIYYLMLITIVIVIFEGIEAYKNKRFNQYIKASVVLLFVASIAVLPNATKILLTNEYGKESIRGGSSELSEKKAKTKGGLDKEYATRWSYGVMESFTVLVPNFKGGSSYGELDQDSNLAKKGLPRQYLKSMPLYWGDQPFTSGPVYFGAIICFLFVLGLLLVRGTVKWILVTIIALSFLLAWGKNFDLVYSFFFEYVPFFNKFRTPSMALSIAQLAVPLLGFIAIKEIIEQKISKEKILKAFKTTIYIVGGMLLLFWLFGGKMFDFKAGIDEQLKQNQWTPDLISALHKDRASLLASDALRSLVFILLFAGLLWAFIKDKIKKEYLIAGLGLLILVDLWGLDRRYLNDDDFISKKQFESPLQPSQIDQMILQDTDPNYRVFNLTRNPFNDAITSYHHKSVGGYHPAKLIRYQDLIERHISQNNKAVLNMLNTKYFIVRDKTNEQIFPQRNPLALGNAWFVDKVKWAANADEEINALNDFIPEQTVIIDKRYKNYLGDKKFSKDAMSTISLLSYKPNHLVYESNAGTDQLAVFSEIYYNDNKGWKAYVDGKYIQHIRGNYVLRVMKIPAGQHKIEFKFEPSTYFLGEKIALAGSLLLLIGAFSVMGIAIKRSLKNDETE